MGPRYEGTVAMLEQRLWDLINADLKMAIEKGSCDLETRTELAEFIQFCIFDRMVELQEMVIELEARKGRVW